MMMFTWNTRSSVLLADKQGRLFQVFKVNKPEFKVRSRISPWSCWRRERLCRKKLRRPHETCFPCRLRRVVGGELPWMIPVKPYICLLGAERGKAKKAVTKGLANAIGLFSQ